MNIRSYIDLADSNFKFCLFEGFDPTHTTRHSASFLFQNGIFVPVAYQQHKTTIGDLAGIDMAGFKDWSADQQAAAYDAVNAYAVSRQIVQGSVQPGDHRVSGYLSLVGSRQNMLTALREFRKTYSDVYATVARFGVEEIDGQGRRIDSMEAQGKMAERKIAAWLRG